MSNLDALFQAIDAAGVYDNADPEIVRKRVIDGTAGRRLGGLTYDTLDRCRFDDEFILPNRNLITAQRLKRKDWIEVEEDGIRIWWRLTNAGREALAREDERRADAEN